METNEQIKEIKRAIRPEYLRLLSSKERPITSLTEETEIIRKVQAGEQDEFRHLVNSYRDLIFAMIVRQVGNASVAEEIAQEVFVRAYFSIKKFRLEARFSTWLTRIALNQTSSYFSSKKFKTQKVTESFDPIQHQVSDDAKEEDLEQSERQGIKMKNFQLALSHIKPAFREVIVLCGLEEKSYQEAADILDIPIGTVRSRLNKARELIAKEVAALEA